MANSPISNSQQACEVALSAVGSRNLARADWQLERGGIAKVIAMWHTRCQTSNLQCIQLQAPALLFLLTLTYTSL